MYRSVKAKEERRLSGAGFMVKNPIVTKLSSPLTGQSDRIISMPLPLRDQQFTTFFSVYGPTLQADPADKDKFYSNLRSLLQNVSSNDKLFVLGDFNARVGRDSNAWKGVLGKHGLGNCNNNGHLILEFCAEQLLSITNTVFKRKDTLKTTWMNPRSKHCHLIDYILMCQGDLKDVHHTRVMPNAECYTDHRLVRCKVGLQFKPKPKKGGAPRKKLNVYSLQIAEVRTDFQGKLQSKLEDSNSPEDPSPEEFWKHIKSTILQSSKKHKDWFDENNQKIQELLARRRSAYQVYLAADQVYQNEWWTR